MLPENSLPDVLTERIMKNQNTELAVIGGTGFEKMPDFVETHRNPVSTPYGDPSSPLIYGKLFNKPIVFLSRHGEKHKIAPHCINYRANIYALKEAGIQHVIGLAAVGGIAQSMIPTSVVIPDQIIDYTWGRAHSYYDGIVSAELVASDLEHIDFTSPYDQTLREQILQAALSGNIDIFNTGVYGVTQGPRLESAAEIDRMENDGVDIVGMTAMPETALARELGMAYATIALVVNQAAGRSDTEITMPLIYQNLERASIKALEILRRL